MLQALSIVREIVRQPGHRARARRGRGGRARGRGRRGRRWRGPGVFPQLAVQMIAVGEETGRLDELLLRVADHFDREVRSADHAVHAPARARPDRRHGPSAVGSIVVSMLSAIFSINESAHVRRSTPCSDTRRPVGLHAHRDDGRHGHHRAPDGARRAALHPAGQEKAEAQAARSPDRATSGRRSTPSGSTSAATRRRRRGSARCASGPFGVDRWDGPVPQEGRARRIRGTAPTIYRSPRRGRAAVRPRLLGADGAPGGDGDNRDVTSWEGDSGMTRPAPRARLHARRDDRWCWSSSRSAPRSPCPMIEGGFDSREVRRAARQIASTMHYCRGEAVAPGSAAGAASSTPTENTHPHRRPGALGGPHRPRRHQRRRTAARCSGDGVGAGPLLPERQHQRRRGAARQPARSLREPPARGPRPAARLRARRGHEHMSAASGATAPAASRCSRSRSRWRSSASAS